MLEKLFDLGFWSHLLQPWGWDWAGLMWTGLLLSLASTVLLFGIAWYLNSQVIYCRDFTRMDGRVVVMTGGTTGIGKEAVRQFLARGARIVMGCQDVDEGYRVAGELMSDSYGGAIVEVLPLDLSSLSSVRTFADTVLCTETRLDILVLNHSQSAPRQKLVTSEGFEVTMTNNYVGHFLLANLLIGLMKITPKSRIVVSVSQVYTFLSTINPKDLVFEKELYTAMRANALAKVCLVLFTRHFAILAYRHGILVNCFCPGFVRLESYEATTDVITGFLRYWASKVIGRTPFQGSQTLMYLALTGEAGIGSGGLFVDCKSRELSTLVSNDGLAQKVFERTETLVQLTDRERRYL